MAKGRHIGGNAKGMDPNAVARSQDMMGNLVGDDAPEVDMELAQEQGQSIAGMFLGGDAQMAKAFPSFVSRIASSGDLGQLEAVRHALSLIEQQRPGAASQIISSAGSPESLAMDFAPQQGVAAEEEPAAPADPGKYSTRVPLEELTTYGSGVRNRASGIRIPGLAKIAEEEYRSKQQRVEGVDVANMPTWQQRLYEFLANSDAYKAARNQQLASMDGIAITPELAAQLSPQQASQIFTTLTGDSNFPGQESLVGMQLTPDAAKILSRAQRDAIAGQVKMSDLSGDQLLSALSFGGKGDVNAQMRNAVSTRDQKIAGMLSHAERGTVPVLDDWFRWWRYQFPTSQGGEIVRPGLAPSGEAMARWTRQTLGLGEELPNWVGTTAPVFDSAIRQQATTSPKTTTYRNIPGKSAQDIARLILPPDRGGYYLKQAEQTGWPFPLFTEGLPMNYGPKEPINLGGLLLDDTISAPQPDATISTPDEPLPEAPTEPPPVMPAEGDVSFYGPRARRIDPSLLAGLLA